MKMYVYQKTFHLDKEACYREITKIANEWTVIAVDWVLADIGEVRPRNMALHSRVLYLSLQLGQLFLKGRDDQSFRLCESLGLVIIQCCFHSMEVTAVMYSSHKRNVLCSNKDLFGKLGFVSTPQLVDPGPKGGHVYGCACA